MKLKIHSPDGDRIVELPAEAARRLGLKVDHVNLPSSKTPASPQKRTPTPFVDTGHMASITAEIADRVITERLAMEAQRLRLACLKIAKLARSSKKRKASRKRGKKPRPALKPKLTKKPVEHIDMSWPEPESKCEPDEPTEIEEVYAIMLELLAENNLMKTEIAELEVRMSQMAPAHVYELVDDFVYAYAAMAERLGR